MFEVKVNKRFPLRSRRSAFVCSAWAVESGETHNESFRLIRQSYQQLISRVLMANKTSRATIASLSSLTLRMGGGGGGGAKDLMLEDKGVAHELGRSKTNNQRQTTVWLESKTSPFSFLVLCSKKQEKRQNFVIRGIVTKGNADSRLCICYYIVLKLYVPKCKKMQKNFFWRLLQCRTWSLGPFSSTSLYNAAALGKSALSSKSYCHVW